jgi:hypothetical protein
MPLMTGVIASHTSPPWANIAFPSSHPRADWQMRGGNTYKQKERLMRCDPFQTWGYYSGLTTGTISINVSSITPTHMYVCNKYLQIPKLTPTSGPDFHLKNGVFWVVTPCGSCKNRRFGGTWRLLHQGDKNR